MLILLTDLLACPRCGPDFGLVALSERMEERRVLEGRLGCSNCRAAYPVRGGVADLRLPGEEGAVAGEDASDDSGAATRLAALMGLAGCSGMVLLAGPGARHAAAVAALVPEVEVVAVDAVPRARREVGVSRVVAGSGGLPFRSGYLRAAALTGGAGDEAALHEGLRVLAPAARLVVDPAPAEAAHLLRAAGARLLLEEPGVAVAEAPGRPVELLRNAVR